MGIATVNPATGETLATFKALDAAEIEDRLQRSTAAFAVNRRRSFEERASRMRSAGDILQNRSAEYGRMITLEMGKPLQAAIAEVKKCALVCRYYSDNAARFLADEHIKT